MEVFCGAGEGLFKAWFWFFPKWNKCNNTVDISHIVILKHKIENNYALNGLCKGKIVVLHLFLTSFMFWLFWMLIECVYILSL